MVKFDEDRSAGWGPFKLPKNDPYQTGAGDHDDEGERKARGLPTELSRAEGNKRLRDGWKKELEESYFRPRDPFARVWEAGRSTLFGFFIWAFQKPFGGWKSGRVTLCPLATRAKDGTIQCICLRDRDRFGNTP